ncbi:MAG: hypothetical protein R3C05_23415 [Pirellulaceae bacterium]
MAHHCIVADWTEVHPALGDPAILHQHRTDFSAGVDQAHFHLTIEFVADGRITIAAQQEGQVSTCLQPNACNNLTRHSLLAIMIDQTLQHHGRLVAAGCQFVKQFAGAGHEIPGGIFEV